MRQMKYDSDFQPDFLGYDITEHLSKRPTTAIYRATRLSDSLPVVLKFLNVEYPSASQLNDIKYECELIRAIDYPGVIKVHALEKIDHSSVIVMDDFGGLPLRKYMAENKLSIAAKLRISFRISEIIGYIHENSILHRDINPNNILINATTKEIKFIDFGCASRLTHQNQELMHPDYLEGTLAYIAPERTGRMNRPVDYRSDYYSLGITLYELFLNKCPFETQDSMEMVHLHIASVPPSLYSQDASIPKNISRVVQKLLEKNAENRYRSSVGICNDIEQCLQSLDKPEVEFVAGKYDVSDQLQIPAKLYGRSAEVKRLMAAYEYVCAGNSALVLVAGLSGIGKSSLIHEIHKPIAKRRGFFIAGKFDQYRRDIPYSALIQAFTSLIQQILTESEDRIAYWRDSILAVLGQNAQVIIDVVPELKFIIGEQEPVMHLAAPAVQNRFHYNFINFATLFAQAEHPLTLFLDDLQWADSPSLRLLELLSSGSACKYQMIIGAYRQNEVNAAHPLQLALKRIKKGDTWVEELSLQPLQPQVIGEIISDTFLCDIYKGQALAELVGRKTAGNPFFINQLLTSMHNNKLISYDYFNHQWRWQISQIEHVSISDNVIDLLATNLQKLPKCTQRLLQLAACIGNHFTLNVLAVVSQKTADDVAAELGPALSAMFIVPVGNACKYFGSTASSDVQNSHGFDVSYRFMHDRIQQGAHDQLSVAEKSLAHYVIGNLLLEGTAGSLLSEKVFDIVNQFAQSVEMVVDAQLRLRVSELSVMAASKAKKSIAYEAALNYIKLADVFHSGVSQASSQLQFCICVERAECEQLNGNREAAEEMYLRAQQKAKNRDQHVVVLESMIHFYTNIGDFEHAYSIGRQAVRLFGVSLPTSFIPPLFLADLARVKWRMRGKEVADLIELPLCQDQDINTAMRLIAALLKAAYQIRPELCIANAVKAVNLSLKHGMMEDSAVSYVVFGGIFVGGVMGRHQSGYDFGKLALAMNERFNNLKQRSEINFVSGYFTDFWLESAQHTENSYRLAYESGLQAGDFFHLSCAACTMVESQFIRGVPVAEVKSLALDYLELMNRIDSHEAGGAITATLRCIQNLQGLTETPSSFADSDVEEEAFNQFIEGYTSQHFAHFYFVNKMQALYLWKEYDQALAVARVSETYLKYSIAMLHSVEHHFYHALILCAVYDVSRNKIHLRKARKILKQFDRWAILNPGNFAHKALLIHAEIERLSSGGWAVADLYAKAIQSADEHAYIQNKALANELAGRFLKSKNIEVAARSHFREAYYGYQLWGATGIADKLAKDFPFVARAGQPEMTNSDSMSFPRSCSFYTEAAVDANLYSASIASLSSSHRKSNLDIETIIKSTRVISSEMILSSLLQKLMKIMIENAGAQKGFFIRLVEGELLLEAEGFINEEVIILEGMPLDVTRLPKSVVQYTARVGEGVVLNDAQSDSRFWDDPYIVSMQPKSLLCIPVSHQGEVKGIIYLENNLISDAFTPDRFELLQMLSTQVAIAIENSLLYANMEQRVTERTMELSVLAKNLETANKALEELSLTDALTQIANKRHFENVYKDEWKRAMRSETLLTLMLIDIDCFKLYNDTYGHVEGDRCLQLVAGALNRVVCRSSDHLARFGGEEFIVILTDLNQSEACSMAERLVDSVFKLALPHQSSLAESVVSISLGVAQVVPQKGDDPLTFISKADQALYKAKTSGRNRFCS